MPAIFLARVAGDSHQVFTPRQGQYLAFIHACTLMNLRPPAQADIQRFFRVTPPSVHQMPLTLEREGLISRRPGMPRSIAVLVDRTDMPALEPGQVQPVKITVPRYWSGYNGNIPWRSPGFPPSAVARTSPSANRSRIRAPGFTTAARVIGAPFGSVTSA